MYSNAKWLQLSCLVLTGALAAPSGFAHNNGIRIAPIDTLPKGQSYGRWAAEWWQWALGAPAAHNPMTDTTGEHCAVRQVDKVWFLAGSFGIKGAVVRHCEIPAGKALFFPLINNVYGAFLNDPPEVRTEAAVRDGAKCTEPAVIDLRIDGRRVSKPERYFTGDSGSRSPLFNAQLPPGNLFGLDENLLPELVLSPSGEEGYYLFLWPLPAGDHTVRWTATGCTKTGVQDIIYHLTVTGKH